MGESTCTVLAADHIPDQTVMGTGATILLREVVAVLQYWVVSCVMPWWT